MNLTEIFFFLSEYCRLYLQGRLVYNITRETANCSLSSILHELTTAVRSSAVSAFEAVVLETLQASFQESSLAGNQHLICWVICNVLALEKNNALRLFHGCAKLRLTLDGEKDCLKRNAPACKTSNDSISYYSVCAPKQETDIFIPCKSNSRPERFASASKSESRSRKTHFSATFEAVGNPKSNSVSLVLPERREMASFLRWCSTSERQQKPTRVCFIRQVDDHQSIAHIRSVLRKSRVKLVLIQQVVGDALRELFLAEHVFFIDRLGLKILNLFSCKLGVQVSERLTEWVLTSSGCDAQSVWSCKLTCAQSRAGVLLTVRVEEALKANVSQNLPPCTSTATHYNGALTRLVGRTGSMASSKLSMRYPENIVLFYYNVGKAFCRLGETLKKSATRERDYNEGKGALEASTNILMLLCRCLM